MSQKHNPKEYIAPYEMLTDWDEVLLGDEELFKEMAEPHMALLIKAAREMIKNARLKGKLQPDFLQPEELVGEMLIEAWEARHCRNERTPLKDWLLEIQKHTLEKIISDVKRNSSHITASLNTPLPRTSVNDDENEYWEWVEPPARECLEDVIPDDRSQNIAA